MVTPPLSTNGIRSTRHVKNTSNGGELIKGLFEMGSNWMDTDQESFFVKRVESELLAEGPVNQTKVRQMMDEAVNQLRGKLDASVA